MPTHDKHDLKKMLKAHRKAALKPLGKMTKSELAAELEKYTSSESVMAPATKDSSMSAKIAEELHAIGAEKPKKVRMAKAPVHHAKEDDKATTGGPTLRMYDAKQEHHHGTTKGEPRKTARKAYEHTPSEEAKKPHASSYRSFVSEKMKAGHSMKDVGEMWRKHKTSSS